MEYQLIGIFVLFLILFILAYIKIRYPFWNIQPVFHSYDFWKYFLVGSNPYYVYKYKPIATKFCDFEKVKTVSHVDMSDEEHSQFLNLVQCFYIESDKVLLLMTHDNLSGYFIGYEEPTFVSFYSELIYEENAIRHEKPIGCISSRCVHFYLYKTKYKLYFLDFLCVHREQSKNKALISRKLIQTHEYNQRKQNPNVIGSLIKKEMEPYPGIVPIISFQSVMLPLKKRRIPKLPPNFELVRVYKENLDILYELDFSHAFDCFVLPEIGAMVAMIQKEILYMFYLKKREQIYAFYFLKDEQIQYDDILGDSRMIHCIGSINNTNNEELFIMGFMYIMQMIVRYKDYKLLMIDNIGNNSALLRTWKSKYTPISETDTSYYLWNLIVPGSPISNEKSFILI